MRLVEQVTDLPDDELVQIVDVRRTRWQKLFRRRARSSIFRSPTLRANLDKLDPQSPGADTVRVRKDELLCRTNSEAEGLQGAKLQWWTESQYRSALAS